jgi:hypothetical protein
LLGRASLARPWDPLYTASNLSAHQLDNGIRQYTKGFKQI